MIVIGWFLFQIVSSSPTLHSRWWTLLKIEISLIFNCLLLLYHKSKWAQILTAATWNWVVQHIFLLFQEIHAYYEEEKNHTKPAKKFELKWSLVGHLSKLFVTFPFSWQPLVFVIMILIKFYICSIPTYILITFTVSNI